jgi:hypothetical protein
MSRTLRSATLIAALLGAPVLAAAQVRGEVIFEPIIGSRASLHDAMRRLFLEHALWTRAYIVSVTSGLPDKDATLKRLLQNQTDIGAEFALYYVGDESGGKLAGLLKEHILTAGQILAAVIEGNAAKTDSLSRKWRANADETSDFLHKLNPDQWAVARMRTMMYLHCDQTFTEMRDRVKKDYVDEIADYDAVEKYALVMADAFSDGIVAQFPAKFGTSRKGG